MLADFHVHSCWSDDSIYPTEQVVKDAIRLNLDELCFTEHVDYGVKPEWDHPAGARIVHGKPVTNCNYPAYFAQLAELREKYAGQIAIRRGLEFGIQVHTIPQFEALYSAWEDQLDFVLLSIHQVDNLEFWMGEYQEGRSHEEYVMAYYEELLRVVEAYDHYSVLAHLDLIRRYDPQGPFPFEKTRDVVAAILERVIACGHGIEVNTSSFRYGLDEIMPSHDVLNLYRDLGGTIVTIGSDSHEPSHLASYLRLIQKELTAMGFDGFYTYENLQPQHHPIEP